ncbi:MAG TPA: DUF916 domain-containing protein [Candidatus Saccharimonadales bacterium]|nr:DUF916 domain-containing protein [Candidatus Saccharimonadales bacterium]
MLKKLRASMLYGALSVLMTGSISMAAFADTSSTTTSGVGIGNGYKISPVRTDLTINPGQSQNLTLYVQNISSVTENLQVLTNDFTARPDNSGGPAILLNGQSLPKHGLTKYITVTPSKATLQPNDQAQVTVTISLPKDIVPGGYYGAVRVAPQGTVSGKNVNLAASVASLILVRVPGNYKEQVSVSNFQVLSGTNPHTVFTTSKGITASVVFDNTGDVQEQPFGKVELKKGSKILGTYDINNTYPHGNVLPDSSRQFTVPLDKVGSFGKYTLVGNFGYGTNGQLLSAQTTFYVIPASAIIIALIVLALLIALAIVFPRYMRRHDSRVLRRAGRR